jgi:hypothetical protein
MNNPPPLLQPQKTPFHRAALISLFSPLTAWVLAVVVNGLIGPSLSPESAHLARQTVGVIGLLLFLTGLVSGIIALLGIRKVGGKGILGRAIVGMVLSGFAILAFLPILPQILREGFH